MVNPVKRVLIPAERNLLYVCTSILWLTGSGWLIFQFWVNRRSDDYGSSTQTMLLKIHGAAAMVFLLILGLILHHIFPGWKQKQQRFSGVSMLTVCILLIGTGWGLYYVGDEHSRHWVSVIHSVLGVVLPAIIIFHIWNIYKRLKILRNDSQIK